MSWIFYRGLDSTNADICIKMGESTQSLQEIARANNAAAFNTLGFIKDKIQLPLQTSNFFKPHDGIYIRKDIIESLSQGEYQADSYNDLDIKMN